MVSNLPGSFEIYWFRQYQVNTKGRHSKHNCLQYRANFHRSWAWQIILICNTASYWMLFNGNMAMICKHRFIRHPIADCCITQFWMQAHFASDFHFTNKCMNQSYQMTFILYRHEQSKYNTHTYGYINISIIHYTEMDTKAIYHRGAGKT